jgi:hypothetical protein
MFLESLPPMPVTHRIEDAAEFLRSRLSAIGLLAHIEAPIS